MKNIALFQKMMSQYHEMSYTSNYILGFVWKHNVYFYICTKETVNLVSCLDKASRGAGFMVRFKPNVAQKEYLLTKGAILLCSEKYFNENVELSKYNKGEIFEKLMTEYFGQEWKKDHIPFTEAGDLSVNGVTYQIKFERATLASEKTLNRLSMR